MEFEKPQGWRFQFGGVNLRSSPDSLPPNKFACAVNIRALSDQSVRTRPGLTKLFTCANNNTITDLRTYATLGTDDNPRVLARDVNNVIYLGNGNNGTSITTLGGNAGQGVSMVPFRPGASPQSWMYVAGVGDYQKISAPDANNNVTVQKVGIAEIQSPCDAADNAPVFTNLTGSSGNWTPGGSGNNAAGGNFFTDTAGSVLNDPVVTTRQSVQVSIPYYSFGMLPLFSGSALPVEEVWTAAATCTISGIVYDSGSSGLCWIVTSLDISSAIGRGAIIELSSEKVLVLGVQPGTGGSGGGCAIRCSTSSTHSSGETITGISAVVVHDSVSASASINFPLIQFSVSPGTATLSQTFASGSLFAAYTPDDYIHVTFLIQDIANTSSIALVFDTSGSVSPSFTTSILTYTLSGSGLAPLLLAGEVVEVHFPISALGGSLNVCTGVQLQVVSASTQTVALGGLWVGGGGMPDIGETGAPYMYLAVPRSSLTGATGNPSPIMRYGVSPRRQSVTVSLPSVTYDSQINVVDVYRFGGSVNSYRYLGTVPSGTSTFTDNYFDDTASAGQPVVETNFEPWPSIDLPFKSTGTIVVTGVIISVTDGSVAWPSDILNWLPGTLVQLSGTLTFTLYARPTQISSTEYLFQIDECAGYIASAGSFTVSEPIVARQFAPYMDGPDANGVFFAVGDQLRPGGLYYSQAYAPDSAPDTNFLELCAPSEPLMRPFVLQTVVLVASTARWWAIYPSFSSAGSYTPIEQPVGRGIVAPFGSCKDGINVYFWAKDGICMTSGGPFVSLTDLDLYPLFPHEGVPGANIVRYGITFYAPDYSRAGRFRLGYINKYLFADYQDTSGNYHTLVCDLRNGAWSQDIYAQGTYFSASCHIQPEQQVGTLIGSGNTAYVTSLVGDNTGTVYKETDFTNDDVHPITGTVYTFEWDGGDQRAQFQFGDQYLDFSTASQGGMSCQPMSLGSNLGNYTLIGPTGANRQFSQIPVATGNNNVNAGVAMAKYLGLALAWADDFSNNNVAALPTQLYLWQSSTIPQPVIETARIHDWMGGKGAQYFRGFTLSADTFGANKVINVRSQDDGNLHTFIGGPANNTVNFNGQGEQAFSFPVAFVSHYVRIEPQGTINNPWRYFGPPFGNGVRWIADPWPELSANVSAWWNLGAPGAKYLRGGTIPIDTNGNNVGLTLVSSDGSTVSLGPFNTTAQKKTEVAFAITPPIVGHEFQLQPQNNNIVRLWWEEARLHFDPYPELTAELTPIMEIGGQGAKYMRGCRITGDSNNQNVTFNVQYDGNQNGPVLGPVAFNGKQTIPFAFTPFVAHDIQVVPQNSVRIFTPESGWDYDPYPELTTEDTPIMILGTPDAKYFRGIRLTADSNNANASFVVKYDGGQNGPTIGPAAFNGKETIAFPFNTPFVAHDVQLLPQNNARVFTEESRWEFDPWPELTTEPSGWINLGTNGAKYFKGMSICLDTNGAAVTLTFKSSDGGNSTFGPFTTTAAQKTEVSGALQPPIVGHEFQIIPSNNCRVWWREIKPHFDLYPELIPEDTSIMELSTANAKYMRGIRLTGDSNNNNISFSIQYDGNQNGPTLSAAFNGKQTIPFAFTPFVAHSVQIVPANSVRIFVEESGWEFDQWQEYTAERSAWVDFGAPGAKYLKSVTIPIDTEGNNVSITLVSSDGGNSVLGPFNTPSLEKTEVAYAIVPPIVGHEFQFVPGNNCRMWWREAKGNFDSYPEIIPAYTSIMELGGLDAKYFRGIRLIGDSNNQNVSFRVLYDGGQNGPTLGPIKFNGKQTQPFSFTPFIGHDVQLVPSNNCRIWMTDSKWEYDVYPEDVADVSSWMDLGFQGAKYLRGMVVPMDTMGNNVTLYLTSSDNNNAITLGNFATGNIGVKTPVAIAVGIPYIGHDFQISKSGPARIWYDEIRWDFDKWPELITEATGWLSVFPDGGAAFVQGVVLPIEAGGAVPQLTLISDISTTPIPLISPVTPIANVRTGVPYSLASPFVAHTVQIVPSAPCRIWLGDIQWVAQRTPEVATTWETQFSALGFTGYTTIPRIEAAWASTQPVTLTITAFDGMSPAVVTLPSTGGVFKKQLITLTFNKAQLWKFGATSTAFFQIFNPDFVAWVCPWGRPDQATPVRNLGGQQGPQASI